MAVTDDKLFEIRGPDAGEFLTLLKSVSPDAFGTCFGIAKSSEAGGGGWSLTGSRSLVMLRLIWARK